MTQTASNAHGKTSVEVVQRLEEWHFWFRARHQLVMGLMNRHLQSSACRIVDVGCGSGRLVAELTRRGWMAVGVERIPLAMMRTKRRFPESRLVQGDIEGLPFKKKSFEGMICLDVLEHLDDETAVSALYEILIPGGTLLLTVPAMPWLWGSRDVSAGHRRRYSRRTLRTLLAGGGFEVQRLFYYQFFLFPLVVLVRLWGKWRSTASKREESVGPGFNLLFLGISNLEARLGKWINWPWGSSLVAVCKRI